MMHKSGVQVAELHETANLLLRRRKWPVCNGFDFLCWNRYFSGRYCVVEVLHLL
jgi:hypothetical protein